MNEHGSNIVLPQLAGMLAALIIVVSPSLAVTASDGRSYQSEVAVRPLLSAADDSEQWENLVDPITGFQFEFPTRWQVIGPVVESLADSIWTTRIQTRENVVPAVVVRVMPISRAGEILSQRWESAPTTLQLKSTPGTNQRISAVQFKSFEGTTKSTKFSHLGLSYEVSLVEGSLDDGVHLSVQDREKAEAVYDRILASFVVGSKSLNLDGYRATSDFLTGPRNRVFGPLSTNSDLFGFPLSNRNEIRGYGVGVNWPDPSTCLGTKAGAVIRHSAEDWSGIEGTQVYAVAAGTVTYVSSRNYPGLVVVLKNHLRNGSDFYSMYGHLKEVLVSRNNSVGKGQQLAKIAQYVSGSHSNDHLHWEMRNFADGSHVCGKQPGYLPEGPGYTYPNHPNQYGYTDPTDLVNSQNSQGGSGGPPATAIPIPAPSCPGQPSSGIILFRHDAWKCWQGSEIPSDFGDDKGYFARSSPGFHNLPNGPDQINDQSSSVRVAQGWSVKLYKHNDTGSPVACRKSNDDNFWPDDYSTGEDLGDSISSFQLFHDGTCGGNQPPYTPGFDTPTSGYTSNDGSAPLLCRLVTGDPNGDQLGFQFEIFDSPVNVSSLWTTDRCWRPSALDRQYHTYKWRVKARDTDDPNAEVLSNGFRTFTINPPNRPPEIDFSTASTIGFSSGSDTIYSRQQNWTFTGTASDYENHLSRVEWRCGGDGCGSAGSQSGAGNWSFSRNGMSGRNDVYFVAYDNEGLNTPSRHLSLNIDLASPSTTPSLNGQSDPNQWLTWYNAPVQVMLNAPDRATGGANSGTQSVRYRVDGGSWVTQNGQSASFTVSGDGPHSVQFDAVDNVGNQESTRTINFQIDGTPPAQISGVVETHGVTTNVWQKTSGVATFQWAASTDARSGVATYQLYFDTDPNGTAIQNEVPANGQRLWTRLPGGVRTGTYYLRGRVSDIAGNWTPWATLFTFKYDNTPPENPSMATHSAGTANDTWQRITRDANFTWPVPHDEGSGIKGYNVAWSVNQNAQSGVFRTQSSFQSAGLCGSNSACTAFLRIQSVDNVDNVAGEWTTVFVLRYDNAPPVADFLINGGVTQTAQTVVLLDITATDEGSGVRSLRFSDDNIHWTPWEFAVSQHPWSIPQISRQTWPIFLQVQDGVDLISESALKSVYLDVNPKRPHSDNYRLFANVSGASGGSHLSTSYRGRSTVAQVMDSALTQSTNFKLFGGYEAGSQAIPLIDPPHDEFLYFNGVFASGSGGDTLQSSLFRMQASIGEMGLPNNQVNVTSSSYVLQPGFLAAQPTVPELPRVPFAAPGDCNADLRRDAADISALVLDIFGEQAGDPTGCNANSDEANVANAADISCTILMIFLGPYACNPPIVRDCPFSGVELDGDATFTRDALTSLSVCSPRATEMMVSRAASFTGASWQSYEDELPMDLSSNSPYTNPRYVYAAFREPDGTVHTAYIDEIIHDPIAPTGTVAVNILPGGGSSFLGLAQVAGRPSFRQLRTAAADAKIGVDGSVVVDRLGERRFTAPLALVGTNQSQGGVQLSLRAQDENSGLAEMQISEQAEFTDTLWQPYLAVAAYSPSEENGIKTVHVRYKDGAGNVSDPVETSFLYDAESPFGDLAFESYVVGPSTYTNTLLFGADDMWSGVVEMRVATTQDLSTVGWQPYTETLTVPISITGQLTVTYYVQYRDLAGNVSEVYSDSFYEDIDPPVLYAEVQAGTGVTRTINLSAYDLQSEITTLHISNDPQWIEGVVTVPYTETVTWVFDDRRAAYIRLEDAVGNLTAAYPVSAPDTMSFAAAASARERERDMAPRPTGWSRTTPRWLPFLWRDER